MKRLAAILFAAVLTVSSASAGLLSWGSFQEGQVDYSYFQDNVPGNFAGTAYLFLLTSQGSTVSWNGTGWNLNGAEQLAYGGNLNDGGIIPGTWGSASGSTVDDSKMSATFYYQVVLLTQPAGATAISHNGTQGLNGYWASTTPEQLVDYNFVESLGAQGNMFNQPSNLSSWAPVVAVPEPATMALFGLGGLALVIRRKMRKEA